MRLHHNSNLIIFSIFVGPPAAWLAFLSRTGPFTVSVSSTVLPSFFTILISLRSTITDFAGSTTLSTASTIDWPGLRDLVKPPCGQSSALKCQHLVGAAASDEETTMKTNM
ncbi:hypothetical protein ACFX13_019958 [Malus domestica]